jgi:hypothetical protein
MVISCLQEICYPGSTAVWNFCLYYVLPLNYFYNTVNTVYTDRSLFFMITMINNLQSVNLYKMEMMLKEEEITFSEAQPLIMFHA